MKLSASSLCCGVAPPRILALRHADAIRSAINTAAVARLGPCVRLENGIKKQCKHTAEKKFGCVNKRGMWLLTSLACIAIATKSPNWKPKFVIGKFRIPQVPLELEKGDLPLNTFSPKKPFKVWRCRMVWTEHFSAWGLACTSHSILAHRQAPDPSKRFACSSTAYFSVDHSFAVLSWVKLA